MLKKAALGLPQVSSKLKGASVILRVDWNVPFSNSKIQDPARVAQTIPTIKHILQHQPKSLVLLSHLGRPNGKVKPELSFQPLLPQFQEIIGNKITFIKDSVGTQSQGMVKQAKTGQIFLCENVRFHLEEEGSVKDKAGNKTKADPSKVAQFRNKLNLLGNFYVNDAFGAAHRAHSSIVGITHPYRAAGLLMKKELQYLGQVFSSPKKPLTFLLGGAKINDKLKLIDKIIDIADQLIIGGGMSYTFQKHRGYSIGKSLFDKEGFQKISEIIEKAKKKGVQIHLPDDCIVARSPDGKDKQVVVYQKNKGIPQDLQGFDIGPATVAKYRELCAKSNTVVWNGPFGFFQNEEFSKGSRAVMEVLCQITKKNNALTIIGGGDTASLAKKTGLEKELSHVSTGGGATLQYLQGNTMPGIESLSQLSSWN